MKSIADAMELVALCDANRALLADMVILCTPSGMHPSQTIAAARAGKHVMTEKPMATRWKDDIEMVKACDDARVRLFVIKQNRRNATLQLLKRAVDEKRFGRIYMVHLNVFWTRPQDYYDQGKWRGTWELDGGAFMNQASHYVDLLEWLISPIADVQAMTTTLARDIEVEDTGVLNVRWRNRRFGLHGRHHADLSKKIMKAPSPFWEKKERYESVVWQSTISRPGSLKKRSPMMPK